MDKETLVRTNRGGVRVFMKPQLLDKLNLLNVAQTLTHNFPMLVDFEDLILNAIPHVT